MLDELSSVPNDDYSLDTAGTTATAASPVTEKQIKELIFYLDYAVMAYETNEELLKSQLQENGGYELILHRTTSIVDDVEEDNANGERKSSRRKPPGRVGYYIAASLSENTLLIGIKGTSTLEELLTDCCGRAVRCDLENDPHCHDDVADWHDEIDTLDDDYSDIDGESDNNPENSVQCSGSKDTYADEDIISNVSEVLESIVTAIEQADKRRTRHEVNDHSDIDLIGGDDESSSSSSYEYFELKTIDDGHETVEVTLLIDNNPKQAEHQQQLCTKRRESHPSENILLLPAWATKATIEDNGIEMQPHRSTKLRGAHEGILHSAQQLLQEISPLIEEYAVSKGFDIVCCGHSLGAGAATLLAILIRGKYASLVPLSTDEERDDKNDARRKNQRVRAYAFAPPPLLDRLSSLACRHYVTSVVNNSDIIPRSSLTNLDVLMTVLEAIICVLTEASMNPGAGPVNNNPITPSIALFRKLSEGTNGKLLMEPRELKRIQKEAIYEATLGDGELDESYWNEEGDHHLLVPGKVLLLYQKWESEKKKLTDPPDNGEGATERDVYYAVWTNGTVKMLKGFEVGGGSQVFTDHLCAQYENALKGCMKGPNVSTAL